jgi:tRNA1(Val) A37 N6-methylase TrmN6
MENEKVHKIKQEENILAIVGNPPYFSGKSSNESKYIQELLKDYKKKFTWTK